MGWNNPDIYNQPEHFGLEIVGELDFENGYGFDTLVVFRETATGRLGYARDSGCSCHAPFEYWNSVEEIEFFEPWLLALKIQEEANESRDRWEFSGNDVIHLIDKVVNP